MENQNHTEVQSETEEGSKQEDPGDSIPILGNIFSAIGLRCNFLYPSGMDAFLLAYSRLFLFPVGSVLWIIFLLS